MMRWVYSRARARAKFQIGKNKNSRAKKEKSFWSSQEKTYPSRPSLRIIGFVIEHPRVRHLFYSISLPRITRSFWGDVFKRVFLWRWTCIKMCLSIRQTVFFLSFPLIRRDFCGRTPSEFFLLSFVLGMDVCAHNTKYFQIQRLLAF